MKLKNNCRYATCENVPRCRRKNPDYCPYDGHSEDIRDGCNPFKEYEWEDHCWICDEHYRLLEFIRNHVNDEKVKDNLCCMVHRAVRCTFCGASYCNMCYGKTFGMDYRQRPPCQKRPLGEEDMVNFTGHWFQFYRGALITTK